MNLEPKVMALLAVVVIGLASAGAYVFVIKGPAEADRPTWKAGYDWWYDSYYYFEDNETVEEETGGVYLHSYNGTQERNGTRVYSLREMDVNNSRLDQSSFGQMYLSVANLNPIDSETGDEIPLYKWPLSDGKSWSYDYEDNATARATVKFNEKLKVPAGTFEAYHISHKISGEEDNIVLTMTFDYYYSAKVKANVRQEVTFEIYEDNSLVAKSIQRQELLAYGLSDSDGDGLSDGGERWLGSDPGQADTDGDGVEDGADYTPLFDLQVALELRRFATTDDCESFTETTVWGETEGCDIYFIVDTTATADNLETNPVMNQDNFDMEVLFEVDVPDDLDSFDLRVEAWDDDSSGDGNDDDVDVSEGGGAALGLSYEVFENDWRDGAFNRYQSGNEYTTSGDGGGNHDGDLTFFLDDTGAVTV